MQKKNRTKTSTEQFYRKTEIKQTIELKNVSEISSFVLASTNSQLHRLFRIW